MYSGAVNGRTDNAVAKKKRKTKGQTIIENTLHRKLMIEQRDHHNKPGWSTSCFIRGTHCVTVNNIFI